VYEVGRIRSETGHDHLGRFGVGDVAWGGRRAGRLSAIDSDVDTIAADDSRQRGRQGVLAVLVNLRRSPLDPDRRRVDYIRSYSPRLTRNYTNNTTIN